MSQDAFISAVMDRPALWQSKHPCYKNKAKKFKLWMEIKELFPGSEVSELKKRWKNLKDTYRKELKKVPAPRSGDPGDNYHENQWKYFELLAFVRDEIIPASSESNLETSNADAEEERGAVADADLDSILTADVYSNSTADLDIMENLASLQDVRSPDAVQSPISLDRPSRKRSTPNELRAEYLEIEKRKLQLLESEFSNKKEGPPDSEKSEDYHFLMSILPQMEKLAPIQKMRLRNKINQALMDEMNVSLYGGYNTQPM